MNRYLLILSFVCIATSGCDNDSDTFSHNCPDGKKYDEVLGCIDNSGPTDKKECTTDNECPNQQVCRDKICKPECTTNDECKNDFVCVHNICKAPDPECTTNDNCPEFYICTSGKCIETPMGKECKFDYDCKGDEICKHGYCVDELPSDSCNNDDDCTGDLVCVQKRCSTPGAKTCKNDNDCSDGKTCKSGSCTDPEIVHPCANDDDCKDDWICIDKVCAKDPLRCDSDFDCDRTAGFFCSNHHCIDGSIECHTDQECTTPKICKKNACVYECQDSDECGPDQTCKGYRCLYDCSSDSECAEFFRCQDHYCINHCTNDNDCLNGAICRSEQCQHECTVATQETDCKNNPNGQICVDNQCKICGQDSDCDENMACMSNQCVEAKNIVFPCILNNQTGTDYTKFVSEKTYQLPLNADGSVDLCRIGYRPSQADIDSNNATDKCMPFYSAREFDFYGDGIDSNCDGYDYDLSTAIFVDLAGQAMSEGNNTNDGKYHPDKNYIMPKSSINGALDFEPSAFFHAGLGHRYYPDIIVSKTIQSDLDTTIKIPDPGEDALHTIANILNHLNDEADIKSAYEHHLALIDELTKSPSNIGNFAFYRETSYPKNAIRIFGGFTRNASNRNQWTHLEQDRTTQTRHISTASQPFYTLIEPNSDEYPISISLYHFDLNIYADATSRNAGTTITGINCGKIGCRNLTLNDVTLTVQSPNGISHNTETPDAGENGTDGDAGFYMDTTSSQSVVCGTPQTCGTISAGIGGCGGYEQSDVNTFSETDYYGNPNGRNGSCGENITYNDSTVAGGPGGDGLSVSISNSSCSDDSIDPDKGSGANGADGDNGINGESSNITFSFLRDNNDLYIDSDYDSAEGIHGSDGAPGGGGGGAAVYQMYSKSVVGKSAWISASAGGNGGCGGIGGKAGGTGGSAIGIIARAVNSGTNNFSFDNVIVNATAGNGGYAQSGSAGGDGGTGGASVARHSSNQCQKATPAGNGGKGGGGGAGAGGSGGRAYAYLLVCGRPATDDCNMASLNSPCFVDTDFTTLSNCGFYFSKDFLIRTTNYGKATAGSSVADSTSSAQTGNVAATELAAPGDAAIVKTYIE